MRITSRQLRQIIKEELYRSHINESAPPIPENRRVAQILGDMIQNADRAIMDDRGMPVYNPKYITELQSALADSPFWSALLKGYAKTYGIGYKVNREFYELFDKIGQMIADLNQEPYNPMQDDIQRQAVWRALMQGIGYEMPVTPGSGIDLTSGFNNIKEARGRRSRLIR